MNRQNRPTGAADQPANPEGSTDQARPPIDLRIRHAEVSAEPVDPAELLKLVTHPAAGATALFVGQVRDHDPEAAGEVVALDYTCHPSAPERIIKIVAAALDQADPDGVALVAAAHRIGRLTVGDPAFVVAVSAPHRALAFRLCELVVDRVKAELPVWKQQFTADGDYTWPGLS